MAAEVVGVLLPAEREVAQKRLSFEPGPTPRAPSM